MNWNVTYNVLHVGDYASHCSACTLQKISATTSPELLALLRDCVSLDRFQTFTVQIKL